MIKWRPVVLTERAAAQEHFLDLCRLFEHPTPVASDPKGTHFTFEKGVKKAGGGDGFADVWKKGFFAWEYKKKKRDLDEALGQLSRYALALESPPLHVVCDTDRFRIVTAYTNCVPKSYDLSLEDILDDNKRLWLESAFYQPDRLQPGADRHDLTKEAADKFSVLVELLLAKGHNQEIVSHFVNQLVFLFFADDVRIFPNNYFRRAIDSMKLRPGRSKAIMDGLFSVLRTGGQYGIDDLPWINGGLFDERQSISLDENEISLLADASAENWSQIDPSIFGTLFERFLDPAKRSQIGAHYTDTDKIMKIAKPVIVDPLRAEWAVVHQQISSLMDKASKQAGKAASLKREAEKCRSEFIERLRMLRILDPACGSGNFLYVALRLVKDIEHAANQEAEVLGLDPRWPTITPDILHGIEINPVAAELARTTIWIGDIQWNIQHGFRTRAEPVLNNLNSIERGDALIDENGKSVEWPSVDYIIGNPPFLGDKKMIQELGYDYTRKIRSIYATDLEKAGDLVCFWFAKAWKMVKEGRAQAAGFVATNSIRNGSSNQIIRKIAAEGRLFDAWDDEPWIVEGAAVRVSTICFEKEPRNFVRLDGVPVAKIHPNLTSRNVDVTQRKVLAENEGVCFVGVIFNGEFEISHAQKNKMLSQPRNINGLKNDLVLRPCLNGDDFNGDRPDRWVVDFGSEMKELEASLFEMPFSHLEKKVKPFRQRCNEDGEYIVRAKGERENWWRHARSRKFMREALAPLPRYIATPMVSSYRVFDFLDCSVLPDQKLVVFARSDEAFLGVLTSRIHHVWTLACCAWIGAGNDVTYSNTAVFDTFPFPEGLTPQVNQEEWLVDERVIAINEATHVMLTQRNAWLKPEGVAISGRTLGRLYAEERTWLANAHAEIDRAVLKAYGLRPDVSAEEIIEELLKLNTSRSAANTPSTLATPAPSAPPP